MAASFPAWTLSSRGSWTAVQLLRPGESMVEESLVSGKNRNGHYEKPEDDGLVHWEVARCLGLNSLVNLLEKAVNNL